LQHKQRTHELTIMATTRTATAKALLKALAGWALPYDNVERLKSRRRPEAWVTFRDGLINRWLSLNVVTGLILGAVSTVVCSSIPLSAVAFALGIVSLLSSLTSIGFGTGLIYVLGDVRGETLQKVADRYPRLFPYALAIPQLWAAGSFCVFFVEIFVIAWSQPHGGWVVKIGVLFAVVVTIVHLAGFLVLHLSKQDIDKEAEFGQTMPMPPPESSGDLENKFFSGPQVTSPGPSVSEFPMAGDGFGFIGGFGGRARTLSYGPGTSM